jgi:3-oxo-5-alpha-steroid 4-dehydrogenase 1
MEAPGFLTLLYVMNTLPAQVGLSELPWENKIMGALVVLLSTPKPNTQVLMCPQVIHYLYRAILAPLIAPSMSPIHPLVWALAFSFQVFNGLSLGGWLGGYGPTSRLEWSNYEANYKVRARMTLGTIIWALGFFGNVYHDDELREIRRAAARNQKKRAEEQDESTGKGKDGAEKKGVDKVYVIPKNGLFWWILYPHYLCEWIEWGGFYIMGGLGCVPARNFLVNEIATMLPRALDGKKWYEKRFGKDKLEGRKAIIPGIW